MSSMNPAPTRELQTTESSREGGPLDTAWITGPLNAPWFSVAHPYHLGLPLLGFRPFQTAQKPPTGFRRCSADGLDVTSNHSSLSTRHAGLPECGSSARLG
ncbi:hypothetical protein ANO14919_065330 [Xylariales sp. No.14919]|nr:hypothetical protein ANO14919_065330 [Xylariales sp. No.14919]